MHEVKLSVIIPTHNRVDSALVTIEHLLRQRLPVEKMEIVVVANNCTDQTFDRVSNVLRGSSFRSRVVEEFRPGLNAARNRGAAESMGEILAYLDDDTTMDTNYAESLLRAFSQTPADLIGARTLLNWDLVARPDFFRPTMDHLLSTSDLGDESIELFDHVGIVGANFAFRAEVYRVCGAFCDGLDRCGDQLIGGGESEFVERAIRMGYRAFYSPQPVVQHWVAPKRVQPKYLLSVAEGNARGRTRQKQFDKTGQWIRSIVGNLYLYQKGVAISFLLTCLSRPSAALEARIRGRKGLGALKGLMDRIFGAFVLNAASEPSRGDR